MLHVSFRPPHKYQASLQTTYLDIEGGHQGVVKLHPLAATVPGADVAVVVPRVSGAHVHYYPCEMVVVVFLRLGFLLCISAALHLDTPRGGRVCSTGNITCRLTRTRNSTTNDELSRPRCYQELPPSESYCLYHVGEEKLNSVVAEPGRSKPNVENDNNSCADNNETAVTTRKNNKDGNV